MSYYVGDVSGGTLGSSEFRYFYALRTDDEGTLYFTRIDQWTSPDTVTVNKIGLNEDNWDFFEIGFDFFEGVDPETKERPYPNLYFDQYRFDGKSMYYYINANGELVVRVNQEYVYSDDEKQVV